MRGQMCPCCFRRRHLQRMFDKNDWNDYFRVRNIQRAPRIGGPSAWFPYGDYSKTVFPDEKLYGPLTSFDFGNAVEGPIPTAGGVRSVYNPRKYIPYDYTNVESSPSLTREEISSVKNAWLK